MSILSFVEPWVAVGRESRALVNELKREMCEQHVLWGRELQAIGRRLDSDDVLFEICEDVKQYAEVHLTYSSMPESNPEFPWTVLFSGLDEWICQGMMKDHREWSQAQDLDIQEE